jgi:hypothetical protein
MRPKLEQVISFRYFKIRRRYMKSFHISDRLMSPLNRLSDV